MNYNYAFSDWLSCQDKAKARVLFLSLYFGARPAFFGRSGRPVDNLVIISKSRYLYIEDYLNRLNSKVLLHIFFVSNNVSNVMIYFAKGRGFHSLANDRKK